MTVGIPEAEQFSQIKLGPNPSKGTFVITNPSGINGTVKAYDLNGKLLLQKDLLPETSIDLNNYASGIYVVKIFNASEKEMLTQKVIKE
jgi:hypothetical protein